MNEMQALGIMSGSSLDGLDISCCRYFKLEEKWNFEFIAGEIFPFENLLLDQLREVRELSALEMTVLDIKLGTWIGEKSREFITRNSLSPKIIGCHGHTVFHEPDKSLTLQIGNGHFVAKHAGVLTCSDFRAQDVANGGQGAPLVPIGDVLFFDDYDGCLNLGGIANMTTRKKGNLMAFDVCSCNQVLNHVANKLGLEFDDEGIMARKGETLENWKRSLEKETYYDQDPPKSMGNEWVEKKIIRILPEAAPEDLLHTYCHFVAARISDVIEMGSLKKVLVTGGGAFNTYLMDLIRGHNPNCIFTIPEDNIVNFKEALVFGLMAVLKLHGETNILGAVTGSSRDLSAGVLYSP